MLVLTAGVKRIASEVQTATPAAIFLQSILTARHVSAADTPGIDDDTVITVEQAGSVAISAGDYGWDSRGAVFDYESERGDIVGSLGRIMFTNRAGVRKSGLWAEWGGVFPDWWGRMLAEKIRSNASDSEIENIRFAFEEGMIFNCTWIIAIGTKSSKVGGSLYKTLRTDNTLRVSYGLALDGLYPEERLFAGSEMAESLSAILPGERWGSSSQAVFAERNPYKYEVQIRSFDVNVYATNCPLCAAEEASKGTCDCTHLENDTYFCIKLPISYNGVAYDGEKTFAWEGQTVTISVPELEGYIRDSESDVTMGLSGVPSDNCITPTQDCSIILAYEKEEQETCDLTVRYVLLNESTGSVKQEIKTQTLTDRIVKGSVFDILLDASFTEDGTKYLLDEAAASALSYAASPKYLNAIKGTRAYAITIERISNAVLKYAASQTYDKSSAGTLFVPVITENGGTDVGSEESQNNPDYDPDDPGAEDTDPSAESDEKTTEPSIYTTGNVSAVDDPAASVSIRSEVFSPGTRIPSGEDVFVYAKALEYMYRLDAEVVSGQMPINVTVDFGDGTVIPVTVYRDYRYVHLKGFSYYTFSEMTLSDAALEPSTVRLSASAIGLRLPQCSDPVVYGGSAPFIGGNIELPEDFSYVIEVPKAADDASQADATRDADDTLQAGSVQNAAGVYDSDTAGSVGSDTDESADDDGQAAAVTHTKEEALQYAEAAVGRLRCRNDEIIFDGSNLLGETGWHVCESADNTAYTVITAPEPNTFTADTRLISSYAELKIGTAVRNGTYPVTTRTITYTPTVRYGSGSISGSRIFTCSDVRVFTPVLCNVRLTECDALTPNISYNQEAEEPDSSVLQLVIGETQSYGTKGHEYDSADFYLQIDNSGYHPYYASMLGSSHDYRFNSSGTGLYIETNEVCFPFDVCMDVGNDQNTANDITVRAGTWLKTGSVSQRYYLTGDVAEGDYCIEVRSLAVNARSSDDFTAASLKNGRPRLEYNTQNSDYVASDSVMVHVSGKMYGLTLYDVSSEEWKEVFSDGSVNKYIALQSGSLKLSDGTLESVLPTGRTALQLLKNYAFSYHAGTGNELGYATGRSSRFVLPLLAGAGPIKSAVNAGMLKTGYTYSFELCTTGQSMTEQGAQIIIQPEFYCILPDGTVTEDIELYCFDYRQSAVRRLKEAYPEQMQLTLSSPAAVTEKYLATWRFDYSLPAKLYVYYNGQRVTSAGTGGSQTTGAGTGGLQTTGIGSGELRITDRSDEKAYLLVRFVITAVDKNKTEKLKYASPFGYCNMWITEGQPLSRTDCYGTEFEIKSGTVLCVELDSEGTSDYITVPVY